MIPRLAGHAAGIGPALPRPHHARGEAGEVPLLVAVMPQMKLMAVMVAVVMTATTAAVTTAMLATRGRIARGHERGGGERNHGNGGYED